LTTPIGPPRPGKDAGLSANKPDFALAIPRRARALGSPPDVSRRWSGPKAPFQSKGFVLLSMRRPFGRRETVCGACHSPSRPRRPRTIRGPSVAAASDKARVKSNPARRPPRRPEGPREPTANRIRVSTNHRIVKESRPSGRGARLPRKPRPPPGKGGETTPPGQCGRAALVWIDREIGGVFESSSPRREPSRGRPLVRGSAPMARGSGGEGLAAIAGVRIRAVFQVSLERR